MIEVAATCLGGALFLLLWSFGHVEPLPAPTGGRRALARARGHRAYPVLRHLDPLVRRGAAIVNPLLSARLRSKLDAQLRVAGSPFGWTAAEFLVMSLLTASAGGCLGALYARWLGGGPLSLWVLACVMAALPWLRTQGLRQTRMQAISRALPGTIDICALCMNAGLDFSSALGQLVHQAADPDAPLVDELRHVLRAMTLGLTRAQALQEFATCAPIPSVREVVQAIIQGEQKGTPLSEVLTMQAQALRQARSVAAEEAAARAAALLVLPLLLLMGSVMLIMIGPFAVEGFGL